MAKPLLLRHAAQLQLLRWGHFAGLPGESSPDNLEAAEGSMALTAVQAAEPSTARVDFYVIWHSTRTPGETVLSLHLQHWHQSANSPHLEKRDAVGNDVLI